MTSYILILTIIHASIGAVDTQRVSGFESYQDCAEFAVGWAETQQPLQPNARIVDMPEGRMTASMLAP
ncbi:MAG: hypothetical protein WB689_22110 [Xanthobacteraceae bacterium]